MGLLRRRFLKMAAIAAATMLLPAAAPAAPQILAVMASSEPIPFICSDRECYGLVGTFCLQRDRDIPVFGQPYEPTLPHRLTVSLVDGAGTVTEIDGAAAGLRFQGYSGYSMVRVSLPRAEMVRLGAVAVSLQVGPGISLVPQETADDRNPQSPQEIALATGPLRIAAARYLDRPSVSRDSARLVAALINGLPERRTIHDSFDGLWDRAIGEGLLQESMPEALRNAQQSYRNCVAYEPGSLRQCLLAEHRQLMIPENRAYWDESAGY
ncbi:MAG TPA: twin-arginine translocation signal domain-containing protein [Dongiaceae bacterium]